MDHMSTRKQTGLMGFEVFTAVTMKNAVFWNVALCGFIMNRRFGGTCRLRLQKSVRL
jgi:hypothetical protein